MKLAIPTLALLAGCVSTGRYDALQKQLDQTQARLTGQLQDRDRRLQVCEAQVRSRDTDLAVARRQAEDDSAEIRRLDQRRIQLETQLAALVRDRSALKATTDELRAALEDTDRRKGEAERRVAELRRLLAPLKAMIDAGTLTVKIVDGRMVLSLGADVLFPTGVAELSPEGRQTIDAIAQALLLVPERRIQVEGHTDSVPIHNARFRSNWELGAGRAITIVGAMLADGVAPARASAASFGEHRPVGSNDSDAGRQSNRRIEIVIVPDLSSLPGFDELRAAVETP
jgi:chemotaxis protein MotB